MLKYFLMLVSVASFAVGGFAFAIPVPQQHLDALRCVDPYLETTGVIVRFGGSNGLCTVTPDSYFTKSGEHFVTRSNSGFGDGCVIRMEGIVSPQVSISLSRDFVPSQVTNEIDTCLRGAGTYGFKDSTYKGRSFTKEEGEFLNCILGRNVNMISTSTSLKSFDRKQGTFVMRSFNGRDNFQVKAFSSFNTFSIFGRVLGDSCYDLFD